MRQGDLYVMGIDPGVHTGWCVLAIPYLSIYGDEDGAFNEFETGEILDQETNTVLALCDKAKRIQRDNRDSPPPVLVCEDFELRHGSMDKELLSPVRVLAMLRFAVNTNFAGDAVVLTQTASMAKSTATPDRLKAWGLYTKGSEHKRDATSHAITFIRRARKDAGLRRAAWGS